MIKKIKTFVIPATSSDDRFLDLTETTPSELLPLGDVPVIQHIVEEALSCNAKEVLIITSPRKKVVFDHFLSIKERAEKDTALNKKYSLLSFSHILQKKKTNNAYTVSRAEKTVDGEPFMFSSPSLVLDSKNPISAQLFNVFRTSEKPVITLCFDNSVPYAYVAEVEKIANRLYKVKKIVEKSKGKEGMPGVLPKYILTGVVFDYLKNIGEKDTFLQVLGRMLGDGKMVYGYEAEGRWFSLHDHRSYVKNEVLFSIENSRYSSDIKKIYSL